MSKTEKDLLIDSAETGEISPTWRHAIILPVMFGLTFGGQLSLFVQNEWTQNAVKNQYFPNETVNFSECEHVNKSTSDYKNYEKVQQETAKWQIFYCLAEMVPTAVLQLVLPSYTDSYGRRFLLIIPATGLCLKAVGITLTVYFKASFWYLVASNFGVGITGSVFAMFSATFSMVADLTISEKHRTFGIVLLEATMLFGGVLSSYLSGYFIETIGLGYYYTALIGACISGFSFLLLLFVPESLSIDKRSKPKSILGTIKRMTDFYISDHFKGQRASYLLLLFSFSFATLTGINRNNMETLFLLGQPFCWDPSKIGVFIMVRSASQGIVGLAMLRFLQMCLSASTIAIISPLSNAASYIVELFSRTTLMIYMVPLTGLFSFLVVPMIRSLTSSMTSPDRQGAVFAGLSFIEVVSTIVANLSQNAIYSFTMSFMDGFVFLILAILSIINSVLMLAFKCTRQEKDFGEVTVQRETNFDKK